MYLGWNLNAQWSSNTLFNTLLLKDATAQSLLQQLEAIQLGYGAVIISFLGAIHWVSQTAPHAFENGLSSSDG